MQLVSFAFPAFLAGTLLVYWRAPARAQNVVLLVASLAFCASFDVRFALLLVGSTGVEFAIGRRLAWERPDASRVRWMWAAVVFDLGLLAIFRYFDFFAGSASSFLGLLGVSLGEPVLRVLMPVGLSFYTLARLSHSLDVYYRILRPSERFLDFATFVSFFPTLVAGPVERARNMLPQFATPRVFDLDGFYRGVFGLFLGLFKKVFLADHCGQIASRLLDTPAHPSTVGTLVGIYAYAFQIYLDFAGYSDIARGSARLFGLHVMPNFDAPYASTNLAEHWRRWHISLSSFLDEYVYKPCAMTLRYHGNLGIVVATFVTFLVSGLWHGRGWTFVVWGLLHATGLSIVTLTAKQRKRLKKRLPARPLTVVSVLVTFHVVCLGYVFFRAPDVTAALATLTDGWKAPLGYVGVAKPASHLFGFAAVSLAIDVLERRGADAEWIFGRPLWVRVACYATMLACVLRFHAPTEAFVYFQF